MSFDTIQLPSSVLSDLFKQVVVTDDYANMPGSPARKSETIAGPAGTVSRLQTPTSSHEDTISPNPVQQAETHSIVPAANPEVYPQPPVAAQPETPPQVQAPVNTKPNPAGGPVSDAPYRMLGKNARHVAIVVNCPTEPFLPEDQLQLLAKMLEACKLNLGDVAIVNHATQAVRFEQLNAQLQPRQVILFGVLPEHTGMPLSFPPFKEQEYAGCTYLLASSLQAMNQPNEEGKSLKGKLWGCLKKMFNI